MKPRFLKSLAHAFLATGSLPATLALWWALRSFRRGRADGLREIEQLTRRIRLGLWAIAAAAAGLAVWVAG